MEDSKREVPAEAAAEARFFELFKVSSLGLDGGAVRRAADLFLECRPAGNFTGEEIERYWMASALYCVAKLGDCRGFNLSSTLKAAKLNAVDFFREIPQFMIRAGHALSQSYGPEWEKRLEVKEAQTNMVHLRVLNNYYRRAYEEFFLSNNMSNGNNNSQSTGSTTSTFVSNYHQFGWLLLLALRIHAFSRFRDLVTCTNGLVSILAILILHVPIQFRKFHVLDSARLVKRSDKGLELLASLCDIYHTSEDDLKAALDKTNNLIAEILKKKPCPASDCHTDSLAGINTTGLLYFDGLLDEKSLQSSLLVLEKDYIETSHAKGELDERMFVNDDNSLVGPASPADGVDVCSSKCKFDTSSPPPKVIRDKFSPPCSPMSPANGNNIRNVMITPTPVSTTMTTAKWLRTVISPLPSKPTVELEQFLSSCDRDLTGDIVRRANIILESIFPCSTCGDRSITGTLQGASLMDQIWIDQRKLESMKLYYRVLEAICRADSQMLRGSNLTPLLSNERFHRCMIACAAELVLATHKTVTMMFPAILERTGITAFDLCKVIESFVRYEETLPRELKRHLNSLEERLLESMAWESGSSMYNSLIVARPSLSSVVNKMSLLAEPMPSLDAISNQNASYWSLQKNGVHRCETSPERNLDVRSPKRLCTGLRNVIVERTVFTSPVKDRLMGMSSPKPKPPQLQSAFTTPTRQNSSRRGETCAETEMGIFYSKIIKLAASRMKALCEKLQLSNQIMDCVYCFFQQILNQNTTLFFKRHVDQLMLCCIYGVAKISQLTLTFKEIIQGYKKQPHCKPQVFRSVFVDWSQTNHMGKLGDDHVDIITFYNVVFIPSVKSLLMEIGSAGSTLRNNQCPGDNNMASGASLGSPRLSPFPSLPDMSPKKVSATHNVYVSPLRPSKMDALLSPSSKSFYACVGESTRAYESPSKDLNDINTRLNGGRRVRLNFDIVSDSLVASALGPQNGNSEQAHERSVASDRTIKCEQGNP